MKKLILFGLTTIVVIQLQAVDGIVYQGRLTAEGNAANGLYDFRVQLYDSTLNGQTRGGLMEFASVNVNSGVFVLELSIPTELLAGGRLWLEVAVRAAGTNAYEILTPRQLVSEAPIAAHADSANRLVGAVPDAAIPSSIARLNQDVTFEGVVTATQFVGDGSGLTNLPRPTALDAADHEPRNALMVDDQGRVGIGTQSPSANLTIFDGSDPTLRIESDGDDEIAGRLSFKNASGVGAHIYYDGRDSVEGLRFDVHDFLGLGATALFIDNRFGYQGNVGIGTTGTAEKAKLHIVHSFMGNAHWGLRIENRTVATHHGGIRLGDSGFLEMSNVARNPSGAFARLSSLGTWTTVSDRRLKADIRDCEPLLEKALRLRPVSFVYRGQSNAGRQIGFIAQEVEEILPSFVEGEDLKTLNYAGLSVVAIGAIQEQQAVITELEMELAALTALADRLEVQLSDLPSASGL